MKQLTKAQKIEQFDGLKRAADKMELVIHDLVNGKFKSIGVRLWYRDYIPQAVGYVEMKVSLRPMPIFLVADCSGSSKTVSVYTEDEIESLYRENERSGRYWPQMLYAGMRELLAKYHAEVAA